jgi:citrate lyase subunit beta/citryl-CoA lyase
LLCLPAGAAADAAAAAAHEADALLLDLDGAIDPAGLESHDESAVRAQVRRSIAVWLRDLDPPVPIWVRISPGPVGHDDVREIAAPALSGVCVARTESTTQLDALDAVLSTVEIEAGLPPRRIAVAPVLASAAAVLAAPGIARAARVVGLHLDEVRLRAELGLHPSPDDRELLWARSQVVLASAAAGIGGPIASPPDGQTDLDGFHCSTDALRRLGFCGRECASPDQVAVVNQIFR